MSAKSAKFDAPMPEPGAEKSTVELTEAMKKVEDSVVGKKELPAEFVSGDTNAQVAFTVRIEKDLRERLSFYIHMLKRSGDKNVSVASVVEDILREKVNKGLEELGYETTSNRAL